MNVKSLTMLFNSIAGKPEVNVKSPSILFNPGKRVTFSCEVYSAAPVDVTWSFTKCDLSDDRNCVGRAADVINVSHHNYAYQHYNLLV